MASREFDVIYSNDNTSIASSTTVRNEQILDTTLKHYGLTKSVLYQEASDSILRKLSDKIDDWEWIAVHLDLIKGERATIEKRQKDSSEAIKALHAMEKWRQKLGREATYYNLVVAFLNAKNQELVDIVCKSLSKNHRGNRNHKDFQIQSQNLKFGPVSSRKYGFKSKWKIFLAVGLTIVSVVSLLLFIVCIFLLATEDSRQNLPQGNVLLRNNDTKLLLEYDPSIISSITLTVENPQNITYIYNNTCDSFSNQTKLIDQRNQINFAADTYSYPLPDFYLFSGSILQFAFNNRSLVQSSGECSVEFIVFGEDLYLQYNSFLIQQSKLPGTVSRQCLSLSAQAIYTLRPPKGGYYFSVLKVSPEYLTQVQSIAYEITGFTYQFNLRGQNIGCIFKPQFPTSCTIHPENKAKKQCIFVETLGNEFLDISYRAQANSQVQQHPELTASLAGVFLTVFVIIGVVILIGIFYQVAKYCTQ